MIECVTVELIAIRVGDVRLEVTPAQARELYEALRQLFDNGRTVYVPMIAPVTPAPEYPFVPSTTWRSSPGYVSDAYTSVWQLGVTGGD